MPSRFATVQTKKFHNSSSKLFPKYTKKVTKFGLEVLTGKVLSFWLECIDETDEKFFVFKMQIRDSNFKLGTFS